MSLLLTQPEVSTENLSFAPSRKKELFYVKGCPSSNEKRVLLGHVFFSVDKKGLVNIEHVSSNRPIVYSNDTLFRLIKYLEREINPVEAGLPAVQGVGSETGSDF